MKAIKLILLLIFILTITTLFGCKQEPCDPPPGIDETMYPAAFGKWLEMESGRSVFSRSAYVYAIEKLEGSELDALTQEEFRQYLDERSTFTNEEWETIQKDLDVVRCGKESSSGICFNFCPNNRKEYLESLEKIKQHPLVADADMVSTPSPAL